MDMYCNDIVEHNNRSIVVFFYQARAYILDEYFAFTHDLNFSQAASNPPSFESAIVSSPCTRRICMLSSTGSSRSGAATAAS